MGDRDQADDGFEGWLEQLQERARICCWTEEQKLYQVKLHLGGTAAEVFRMLPELERSKFDLAVESLCKRFQAIEIEELKGLVPAKV